jgi:hypothetical protein
LAKVAFCFSHIKRLGVFEALHISK